MENQIIFDCGYLTTQYYPDINIFHNTWGDTEITVEQFKTAMIHVAVLTETHKPKGIMVDTRNFKFLITPEIQDWYNENIATVHLKSGVKYMAFIASEDIVAQMSIKQTMTDKETKKQVVRFFTNIEEAVQWLAGL